MSPATSDPREAPVERAAEYILVHTGKQLSMGIRVY